MDITPDAAKIKRWRTERGWSQEHLAELAGVGLRTIQRIENGENASRDSLTALAAAFNVDVMALALDAKSEAARMVRAEQLKGLAVFRLVFWIHLGSWALGLLIFAAICVAERSLVMLPPAMWWTVGLAGHGLGLLIFTLAVRFQGQFEPGR